MQIKNNRLFPHPVLSKLNDDYLNSNFSASIKAIETKKDILIDISISLSNNQIIELIEQNIASLVCHIECTKTKFRTTEKLNLGENQIKLSTFMINGNIEIVPMIIASENIKNYKNDDFNKDYDNIGFDIEIGSILAISDQFKIPVIKDIYDMSKIPSIISITKNSDENETKMKIEIHDDKIRILLSKDSYSKYVSIGKSDLHLPIIHSMIIVPALIFVFDELKSDTNILENYGGYRWFYTIKKRLSMEGIELDERGIKSIESFYLAQKILDIPINDAINNLLKLGGDN